MSQKVTKHKDPKRFEAGRKGRENVLKKMKEYTLNDAKKVVEILPIQAMKLQGLLTIQAMKLQALITIQAMKLQALLTIEPIKLPALQDQMMLIFMALEWLLSLPLVFVYFLHITFFRLKIKNSSMK